MCSHYFQVSANYFAKILTEPFLFIISLQVWMDCQHAEDHSVTDTFQDPGHAEGLLSQPEEDSGGQPQTSSYQGAAQKN